MNSGQAAKIQEADICTKKSNKHKMSFRAKRSYAHFIESAKRSTERKQHGRKGVCGSKDQWVLNVGSQDTTKSKHSNSDKRQR